MGGISGGQHVLQLIYLTDLLLPPKLRTKGLCAHSGGMWMIIEGRRGRDLITLRDLSRAEIERMRGDGMSRRLIALARDLDLTLSP